MNAFMVTYDLHRAGQNYSGLIDKLKTYIYHWHAQQSVWIIASNKSAAMIRDDLLGYVDSNDTLIVARLSGEAAWYGFTDQGSKWFKDLLESRLPA